MAALTGFNRTNGSMIRKGLLVVVALVMIGVLVDFNSKLSEVEEKIVKLESRSVQAPAFNWAQGLPQVPSVEIAKVAQNNAEPIVSPNLKSAKSDAVIEASRENDRLMNAVMQEQFVAAQRNPLMMQPSSFEANPPPGSLGDKFLKAKVAAEGANSNK